MDTGCYALNCMRLLAGDYLRPDDSSSADDERVEMRVSSAQAVTCYPQVDQHMTANFVLTARSPHASPKEQEEERHGEGESDEKEKGKEKADGEDEGEGEGHKIDASVECSIYQFMVSCTALAVGEKGEMRVTNYLGPSLWHKLTTTIYETPEEAEARKNQQGASKWWMIPSDNRKPRHKVTEEKVGSIFDLKNTTYYYQLKAFAEALREGVTANSSHRESLKHLPFHPEYDAVHNAKAIDMVYQAAGLKRRGEPL